MVQTVLIYSMGEVIGDGLIKLPFVAGLRAAFPEARISWCAAKGETVYAGPLKGVVAGYIDEVVVEGRNGARPLDSLPWSRPFGGRKFDVVVDTQENFGRSVVARRGAKSRFVSAARHARDKDWPVAVADRLARLLDLATDGEGALQPLVLANADAAKAAEALLPASPTYVGLAPGAGGQDKRWPLEHYFELARRVAVRGWTPVFFFGPDEAEDAAVAAREIPEALQPERNRTDGFAGVKGPLLVIALAGRLAAGVANDAGPGHMLAAGGVPLLSLQQDRRKSVKFRPAAQQLEMLVAEDYGSGMGALPVDAAWDALQKLVAGAS